MKDKIYNFFSFISEYALYGLLFFLAISNALVEIFVVLAFLGFIGRKIIKPDFKFLMFWPILLATTILLRPAAIATGSGIGWQPGK